MIISMLWYASTVPLQPVRDTLYRCIAYPFDAAGAIVYGRIPLNEIQPRSEGSHDFLSLAGFSVISILVAATMVFLLKANPQTRMPKLFLFPLRFIGAGFAIAIVVTGINTPNQSVFLVSLQWLLLTVFLLPFWSQAKAVSPTSRVPVS